MFPCQTTIPYPVKAMHWSLTMPNNAFSLSSGQGRGITYCNDEQVENGSSTQSIRHHRGREKPTAFPASLQPTVSVERGIAHVLFKKRKKVQTQQQPSEPAPESLCVTTVLTSEQTSILDIANLQGIGQREQQQDAFGISPADRYETDGILAVLCDGMGGNGGRTTDRNSNRILSVKPFPIS